MTQWLMSNDDVDKRFDEMTARNRAAHLAADARHKAAQARQVAYMFSLYASHCRQLANERGSDLEHLVDLEIAGYCQRQADDYRELQARYTADADRAGSI